MRKNQKKEQVIERSYTQEDLEKAKEHARMEGARQAFATEQPLERSYSSFKDSFTSANSLLMNGAPVDSKDNTSSKRYDEIKLARAMADGNEYMARYLQLATARMIGAKGPTLLTQLYYNVYENGKPVKKLHEVASRLVHAAWHDYTKPYNIDVAQWRGWDDFLNEDLGVGVPRDGSLAWIVHSFPVNDESILTSPNGYGTALQQMDTKDVARWYNQPYTPAKDGKPGYRVNSGVELDKFGRRVAVYFDFLQAFQDSIGTEVVELYARKVKDPTNYGADKACLRIPVFNERDDGKEGLSVIFYDNDPSPLPNQIIGRGWACTTFVSMHSDAELSKYLMVAARAGASKSLAVKKDAAGGGPSPGNVVRAPNGAIAGVSIQPGQITYLGEGQSIETIDFDLSYEGTLKFTKKMLQSVSAALAVPYAELTNDMDASSFATEHSSDLRNNRLWGARREHARKVLLEPFVRYWFRRCVRLGVFKYGKPGQEETIDTALMLSMIDGLQFQFDAFEHQNPYDMEKAADLRLKNGTSTIRDEILRRGGDPEDVISRRIEEAKRLKAEGILVDGVTYFQGMDKLPATYLLTAEQIAADDAASKALADQSKALADQSKAEAEKVQTALTEVSRRLDVSHNVQQHLLGALGSLDENIMAGGAKTDFTPLLALLTKKEEPAAPTAIVRTYSASEREDGTFDLNTLKVLEQPAIVVRSAPVEEKVVPVEQVPVVDKTSDALDALLAEVKTIADT